MALQAPDGGAGNGNVAGTACTVHLHAPAATGGGGLDTAANIIRDALRWAYAHRRYMGIADYNMHDLKAATRQLHDALSQVRCTILDARALGWLPFLPAAGWIREGVVLMEGAAKVVVKFKELQPGFPCDPCYAMSRCVLNFQAVVCLARVQRHITLGERKKYVSRLFEDVATYPPGRAGAGAARRLEHGHTSFSRLEPIVDECNLPAVFLEELTIATSYPNETTAGTSSRPSTPPPPPPVDDASGLTRRRQLPLTTTGHRKVRLSTFAQAGAVPASQSRERFPVLVRVKAPVYTQQTRAPIDLVMVLDISATMRSGLQQLKQAATFAILNLRQDDRLAMVTFGPRAEQLSEFSHMSGEEKRNAIMAVKSLEAQGGVGIQQGLKKAYKVLRSRLETHRVGGIILLTDGKDIQILKEIQENILRRSFEESDRDIALRNQFPTYTFGFGTNHDPRTLFHLAREGYGTYSVNESLQNIKDAMALCIGGLTSIVAQDVKITIKAAHPEVRISDVKRGLHEGDFVYDSLVRIRIKDLFGDEVKNFIVYVNIPEEKGHYGSMAPQTDLLTVTADYSDPLIKDKKRPQRMIRSDEVMVYVERPQTVLGQDNQISNPTPEVETEVYRANVLDRVSRIWGNIADTSHNSRYFTKGGVKCWDIPDTHKGLILHQFEELLADVDPTVEPSADPDMAALRRKLYNEISKMKHGLPNDAVAALPFMLSWLSSHGWQRAATQVVANGSSFLTVRMQNMIASVETALASTA